MSERVCLGVVAGAHGVRGTVRIKPFTEWPAAVAAYGPVEDEAGTTRYRVALHGEHKGCVLATLSGVGDRDAALALKGTRLYVARGILPEPDEPETFYHADLIGLPVCDTAGEHLGDVVAVQDYGAGDLLELVTPQGRPWLIPFTRTAVPEVDLDGGRIVADPPPETPVSGPAQQDPE